MLHHLQNIPYPFSLKASLSFFVSVHLPFFHTGFQLPISFPTANYTHICIQISYISQFCPLYILAGMWRGIRPPPWQLSCPSRGFFLLHSLPFVSQHLLLGLLVYPTMKVYMFKARLDQWFWSFLVLYYLGCFPAIIAMEMKFFNNLIIYHYSGN
jgi:hypothetical protein